MNNCPWGIYTDVDTLPVPDAPDVLLHLLLSLPNHALSPAPVNENITYCLSQNPDVI